MKRSGYVYAKTAETSGEEPRELNVLKAGVPAVGLTMHRRENSIRFRPGNKTSIL